MSETLSVVFAFFSISAYIFLRLISHRRRIYLPDAWIASLTSHFIGCYLLNLSEPSIATEFLLFASSVSLWVSIFVSLSFLLSREKSALPIRRSVGAITLSRSQNSLLFIVALANVIIVLLIVANPAIRGLLLEALTNPGNALLSARLAITASTEGYLGPGIIRQVRDIFGPIALCSMVLCNRRWYGNPLFIIAATAIMVGMLISGQRFPLLAAIVAIGLAAMSSSGSQTRAPGFSVSKALAVGFVALTSFGLLSFLLGRTGGDGGVVGSIENTAVLFLERTFYIVPLEAIKTYGYWAYYGPTQGASWLRDLSILLPGRTGLSIANELHAFGGRGREVGNAPLFFAVDAWFAFGWQGVVLTSVAFVVIFQSLDSYFWRNRTPLNDGTRIVFFLYMSQIYSPYLFFLNGGLVALAVIGWHELSRKLFHSNKLVSRIRHS